MERGKVDGFTFGIEVPAQERRSGMTACVGQRGRADVGGVGVVDHRALAPRVVEEAVDQP